ncbi:MAG: TetR/AcrR family transcriptional regulator [Promethearchaeota archaeon]
MANDNITASSATHGKKMTRRERKNLKTRNQILKSAKTLFEKKPYEEVKMEEISEAADLSRATLYNHFDNKESIYFEIGINCLRDLSNKHKDLLGAGHSGLEQIMILTEDSLRTQLESSLTHEITRRYLLMNSQAEVPTHVIIKELETGKKKVTDLDQSSIILVKYLEEMRRFEKNWKNAIEKGFSDRSITHTLNPDQLVHFIFMMILGVIDRFKLEQLALTRVKLTRELLISSILDLIRRDLTFTS